MTDAPRLTPARRTSHAARDERLAQALRDNLRRRKEQSRARMAPARGPGADDGADLSSAEVSPRSNRND